MSRMFKRGFYGGKFLPFHKGHKFCIDTAAAECDEVVVILFHSGEDEAEYLRGENRCSPELLTVEQRIAAADAWCRRYPNVRFTVLDAGYIHRKAAEQGIDPWDAETDYVLACTGKFQAVYSSEPGYDAYFRRAYPWAQHRLVDVPRVHVPVSGTMLRSMKAEDGEKWL